MTIDLQNANIFTKNIKKDYKFKKRQFIDRVIQINRVTKVTKGGKTLSFRAVVAVGNENGIAGIGIAKAADVSTAVKKAKTNGLKKMIHIPITKFLSIPHSVKGKHGACNVIMRPSNEGSGVIAGGAVRILLEVAGIKNIIAKQLGASNLLNNARSALFALEKLVTKSDVSKSRDIL
jgi:small subunit ribosomal protein S5